MISVFKIQTRLALLFALVFLLFILGMLLLLNSENDKIQGIMESRREEKKALVKELNRLYSDPPRNMAYDYSYWDEMVDFIRQPDSLWAKENIDVSLETFKSIAAWVFSSRPKRIYAAAVEEYLPLLGDSTLEKMVIQACTRNWFNRFFYRSEFGIIELFTAPVQPTADSKRETQPYGFLVIGRILDEQYIQQIAEVAEIMVTIRPAHTPQPKPDAGTIIFGEPLIDALDDTIAIQYYRADDQLYATHARSTHLSIFFFLILGCMLFLMLLISLFAWLNRPLKRISAALERGDVGMVDSLAGAKSEFGQIARLIKDFFVQKIELEKRIGALNSARQALEESESRYRVVVEQTGQIVYDWDIKSGKISWAGAIPSITGFSLAEYQDVDINEWERLIHPEDRPQALADLEAAANTAGKYFTEYRLKCRDGSYIFMEDNGVFIRNECGENIRMLGAMRDITERKQAEEELQKLASVVRYSNELVNLTSLDGMMIFLNEAGSKMLGIAPEEVGQTNIMQVIPDHHKEMVQNELLPALMESGVWEGELQYLNLKTNKLTDVHALTFTIMDPYGNSPLYLANVSLDITERKQAEARQRILQDKLEKAQRMESLAVLAGGVAHDLNNMLGPVVGYSELLIRSVPEDSKAADRARRIMKSAQDAAEVIQDLLTLARRGKYEMKILDLNQVVLSFLESVGFCKLRDRHTGVELQIRLAENISMINGSRPHLEKVLMNLAANGCEAMAMGGTLTIETEEKHLKALLGGHGRIDEGRYILLRVKDTGSGIDSHDLLRIFEPYFSTKKMGDSGSGLGLPVVYGVIKDHGGHYDVFSEVGKGTEFILYFPACLVSAERTGQTNQPIAGGTESILIVDDSPDQRDMALDMVSSLGYQGYTAANGHEAIKFLQNRAADLLILDMVMEPAFDGLATYRKAQKIHPGQRAIIVSGFAATENVQEMQRLGAGSYLKKPYTLEDLARAIRTEIDAIAKNVSDKSTASKDCLKSLI